MEMPGPFVFIEKELYFLGFRVLCFHCVIKLLFKSSIDFDTNRDVLFVNNFKLHIQGKLDNCNQMKRFDGNGGLIER